jgi:uncharacterized repeat protein (TIGR03837 family)
MGKDVPRASHRHSISVDIFCRVVDNFGDAGVCWRLARRLSRGFGWQVRLFIDKAVPLSALVPGFKPHLPAQTIDEVEVLAWAYAEHAASAHVVVEAFACDPPAAYVERMRHSTQATVWINLEYLSAEAWVSGCHTLPSPQPNGLTKYFFFPGFWDHTGGVVHANDELEAMTHAATHPRSVLARFGVKPEPEAMVALLFCYPAACIDEMLDDAASTQRSLHFLIPAGAVADRLLGVRPQVRDGRITLQRLAFCPQPQFDELLAACDLNFVRGEDSLVRAVLSGKPFVWNIYAQEDYAHLNKLQAFLQWWEQGAAPELQAVVRAAHGAWNNHHWPTGTFDAMMQLHPRWGIHAQGVAANVWLEEDLGAQLADFVRDKLNSQSFPAGAASEISAL